MKSVWIIFAVLCASGCICCAGLFSCGRTLLKASEKQDAEADTYASETVTAVCHNWDAAVLTKRLARDAQPDLVDRLIKAGKPLGALREANPFSAVDNSFFYINGTKMAKVRTDAEATFEHGSARLELTLTNDGSGWRVLDFEINPAPDVSGVRNI